jgi:hypothetical protein
MKYLPPVAFGIFAVCIAVLYLHSRPNPSTPSKWQVVSCAVVKEASIPEGGMVRLKLSGPTLIEAEALNIYGDCKIPVGTVLNAPYSGSICVPEEITRGWPNSAPRCFNIVSEKKR